MHIKHLPRAAEIQQQINYHRENIGMARRMPLTYSGWQEGEGTAFAHQALQMTAEKMHDILVAGIVADAEARIKELTEELDLLGVKMDDTPPPIAPVEPRFVVVDEPEALPVMPRRQVVKPRPIAARRLKKVNGSRPHV